MNIPRRDGVASFLQKRHFMGFLRFLLASAVVIAHTTPIHGFTLTGSIVSVEAFFIISGFYMTLILNKKYVGPGSYRLFITNRFLKLYPIYWIVAAGVLILSVYSHFKHGNLGPLNIGAEHPEVLQPASLLFLAATNLAILGQDIVMFLKFNPTDHGLEFTTNFFQSNPPVFRFLLLPQAWSLGIEITFYLLAPFLVRMRAAPLAAVIAVSLALRYLVSETLQLDFDPWNNRFFPLELAFFLVGALAYKVYDRIRDVRIHRAFLWSALALVVGATLFFPDLNLNRWQYFALFAGAMPFVFRLTEKSRLDRRIGDLSYPIYIAHLLVLWVVAPTGVFAVAGEGNRGPVTLAATVGFSMVLLVITDPIETYRQRRAEARKDTSRPAPAHGKTSGLAPAPLP